MRASSLNLWARFWLGVSSPFRGVRWIFQKRELLIWALAPLLVSFLVFIFGIGWAISILFAQVPAWATWGALAVGAADGGLVWWLLAVGLWPMGLVASGLGLYVIAKLISAPFLALLAERALIQFHAKADLPFAFGRWMSLSARMLAVSLVKALIFGALAGVLFVCSFIPGLNILAVMGFALIVAVDLVDYSFEGMEWGLGTRWQFVLEHKSQMLGLAFSLGGLMLIPGLNMLIVPAAVVGGAEMLALSVRGPTTGATENSSSLRGLKS